MTAWTDLQVPTEKKKKRRGKMGPPKKGVRWGQWMWRKVRAVKADLPRNVPGDRGDTSIKGLACQPARAEAHTNTTPPPRTTPRTLLGPLKGTLRPKSRFPRRERRSTHHPEMPHRTLLGPPVEGNLRPKCHFPRGMVVVRGQEGG